MPTARIAGGGATSSRHTTGACSVRYARRRDPVPLRRAASRDHPMARWVSGRTHAPDSMETMYGVASETSTVARSRRPGHRVGPRRIPTAPGPLAHAVTSRGHTLCGQDTSPT
jgi:hypothetical protein